MYPNNSVKIETHSDWAKTDYPYRISVFKRDPLQYGDIVFLGNSITEHGNDWGSRFDNAKVKNRGISGDTTEGVLQRLNEITYYKSEKVFLLIGFNDLIINSITSEYISENIISIVKNIHENSPNTKIYVQTVLPSTRTYLKEKINAINSLLVAAENSNEYQLVDLHNEFTTNEGLMNMSYSTDGVHLNEEGYGVW